MASISPSRLDDILCRIARLIAITGALTVAIVVASALMAWSQTRGSEQLITDPEQVERILTDRRRAL